MSESAQPVKPRSAGQLPEGEALKRNIVLRRTIGTIWRQMFLTSAIVGLVALVVLLYSIVNETFGLIAVQTRIPIAEVTGDPARPVDDLTKEEFIVVLQERLRSSRLRALEREAPLEQRSAAELAAIVRDQILREEVVDSWSLRESLFNRAAIEAKMAEDYERATLRWHSWLNWQFLRTPPSSTPILAGIAPAILGSLWMIVLTMLIALPLGVSAAIYLEEYAPEIGAASRSGSTSFFRRAVGFGNYLIQTNINNLAGIPSIIYGILGLAVFVRALSRFTSGAMFGVPGADPNVGRTILSASLTMSLLILPYIIINAQEAIRAVPLSIRQASMALGATKWQTIWNHVLPSALPGILTGTILGMSRGIGETAPLIVVGAATFIAINPDGIFSRYTVLPIQIYNWTAQPSDQFRDIAAAAIVVLLILLLSLNSLAVYLRNRFQRFR